MSRYRRSTSESGSLRLWLAGAIALLLAAAAVVYVVLLRDDSDDSPEAGATRVSAFAQEGIPFTFTYPVRFAPGTPSAQILWVAGISPVDIIDVRRVGQREYSAQGAASVYGTTLRSQAGVTVVDEKVERADGRDAKVYVITTSAATPLRSQLFYVAAGGSEWQLECQSQQTNRAELDAACRQMITTLRFS
jgi:hypothetical protein